MTQRQKPDLSSGSGGWIDPDYLPDELKSELRRHLLSSPLNDEQISALLEHCSKMAQMLEDGPDNPLDEQRAQITSVANNARRLLAGLNSLSNSARDALHAHTDYLAFGSSPPVELPASVIASIKTPGHHFLSEAWDWVQSLELAAEYATSQFTIDRQAKTGQLRARGYVSLIATYIFEATGRYPPKDRSAWFSSFMNCLGAHLGMEIGPRIVASGIEVVKNPAR